jgi:hypothetical protein
METATENSWHLQKGVPIALILAIAIQTAGGVWFISALNSTVTEVVERNKVQDDRIDRVESDAKTLQIGAATIVEQLAGMRTSLDELKVSQREMNTLIREAIQGAQP